MNQCKSRQYQCKLLAIKAVSQMRGDDTYRARMAFKGMTQEQMKEQHGQSGKTRAEIIAEYEAHDRRCDEAIAWLNSLP